MKLSVFFSAGAVLFASLFWGCSDLSVNKRDALEAELPDDFEWKKYALINKDVPASQIAFDIQKKLEEYNKSEEHNYVPITDPINPPTISQIMTSSERIRECMEILEDLDFAGKIYLEYANCPRVGWDPSAACTDAYANNPNYAKGETCSSTVNPCWSGGWDQEFDCGTGGCAGTGIEGPFKEELQLKIASYKVSGNLTITAEKQIFMMCRFVLPQPENIGKAKDYLEAFYSFSDTDSPVFGSSLDSTLVKQHYFLVGRSEGRPYKYCEPNSYDATKVRDVSLALEFTSPQKFVYYDYSQNLFCLNECENKTECDGKIYLLKEK